MAPQKEMGDGRRVPRSVQELRHELRWALPTSVGSERADSSCRSCVVSSRPAPTTRGRAIHGLRREAIRVDPRPAPPPWVTGGLRSVLVTALPPVLLCWLRRLLSCPFFLEFLCRARTMWIWPLIDSRSEVVARARWIWPWIDPRSEVVASARQIWRCSCQLDKRRTGVIHVSFYFIKRDAWSARPLLVCN
jgi:hypothetical protein